MSFSHLTSRQVWGLNDIKSTVTSIDDVWTYLNTTAPAAMHPSPGDKCYGGFFSVVVPNYDLPPSDPRSTVGCPLYGQKTACLVEKSAIVIVISPGGRPTDLALRQGLLRWPRPALVRNSDRLGFSQRPITHSRMW